MKSTVLMMAICLSSAAHAQEGRVTLLQDVAHCLAAKGFLSHTEAKELVFGYLMDEQSYPGKKLLYVVNYPAPTRANGLAFTIFLNGQNGRQVINIQNNARFTLTETGQDGVLFEDPPLGGTWTQEHLASAIKAIEKQPRFTISANDVLEPQPLVNCESYADLRTKPKVK